MRAHISWPDETRPVSITDAGGKDTILSLAFLRTQLQQAGLRAMGIVIDADLDCVGRYQSIYDICRQLGLDLPREIPSSGLILETPEQLRFGVWIMPNNSDRGLLEDFLTLLIPEGMGELWRHVGEATTTAKNLNAPCTACEDSKAHLSTWLAWQNPPGNPPGTAITARVLDPNSPHSEAFVDWFRKLYGL